MAGAERTGRVLQRQRIERMLHSEIDKGDKSQGNVKHNFIEHSIKEKQRLADVSGSVVIDLVSLSRVSLMMLTTRYKELEMLSSSASSQRRSLEMLVKQEQKQSTQDC
eukprot:g37287.t1